MLHLLALTLLLSQEPGTPPIPTQAPASALGAAPSALAGQAPAERPRVDKLKPYMRVWYWPPTPGQAVTATTADAPYAGVGDYTGGAVDPVRFPTNRVRLVSEQQTIHGVAAWLAAHPGATVQLDGYADARGSAARNEALSQARAEAVRHEFVVEGVDASRITVKRHGATTPVAGETTDEGWWLSRRVTITVLD